MKEGHSLAECYKEHFDMSLITAVFIVFSIVGTSIVSGVFGMAGGMLLMGLLLAVLPVTMAMILHGFTQIASNGWRGVVWRRYVNLQVIGRYAIGLVVASTLFFFINYIPERAVTLMFLGTLPVLVLIVPNKWIPQVDRPWGAEICGFLNGALQLIAGISGPVLDAFFIRTSFDRRMVIATKAISQTCAHLVKLIYFSHAALTHQESIPFSLLFLTGCALTAIVGTMLSRKALENLSDHQFRYWTKRILLLIGIIYFSQGLLLYFGA